MKPGRAQVIGITLKYGLNPDGCKFGKHLREVCEYPIAMKLELIILKYWIRLNMLNLSHDNMSMKMFIELKSLAII